MSNAIFVDDPKDVLAAFRELRALSALEDMREQEYEDALLRAELLRVLDAVYEKRISLEAAIEACRLIEKAAEDPLLSQERVEALWALCAEGHITWRELLFIVDIEQDEVLRVKAERLNNGASRDRGSCGQ